MIRLLSLSACLLSLIFVVAASAQQLTPKPGFTEKRDRVLCGRLGWPKPSMHDRALEGCKLEASLACPVRSRLSAADSR
jgi:hypothetical protein